MNTAGDARHCDCTGLSMGFSGWGESPGRLHPGELLGGESEGPGLSGFELSGGELDCRASPGEFRRDLY